VKTSSWMSGRPVQALESVGGESGAEEKRELEARTTRASVRWNRGSLLSWSIQRALGRSVL